MFFDAVEVQLSVVECLGLLRMLSMPREPVENLRVLQYPGGLQ